MGVAHVIATYSASTVNPCKFQIKPAVALHNFFLMAEVPQNPAELAEALKGFTDINFQLPDPEDEQIPDFDFDKQVDNAWKVCVMACLYACAVDIASWLGC